MDDLDSASPELSRGQSLEPEVLMETDEMSSEKRTLQQTSSENTLQTSDLILEKGDKDLNTQDIQVGDSSSFESERLPTQFQCPPEEDATSINADDPSTSASSPSYLSNQRDLLHSVVENASSRNDQTEKRVQKGTAAELEEKSIDFRTRIVHFDPSAEATNERLSCFTVHMPTPYPSMGNVDIEKSPDVSPSSSKNDVPRPPPYTSKQSLPSLKYSIYPSTSKNKEVSKQFLFNPLEELFNITEERVFRDSCHNVVDALEDIYSSAGLSKDQMPQVTELQVRSIVRTVQQPINTSLSGFIRQALPDQLTAWLEIPSANSDMAGQFMLFKLRLENGLQEVPLENTILETKGVLDSGLVPVARNVSVTIIESLLDSSGKKLEANKGKSIGFKKFLGLMANAMKGFTKGRKSNLKENSDIVEREEVSNCMAFDKEPAAEDTKTNMPKTSLYREEYAKRLSIEDLTMATFAVNDVLTQASSSSDMKLLNVISSPPNLTSETFDMVQTVAKDIESLYDALDETVSLKSSASSPVSENQRCCSASMEALHAAVYRMYTTVHDKLSAMFTREATYEDESCHSISMSEILADTKKQSKTSITNSKEFALSEKLSKTSVPPENGAATDIYEQYVDKSTDEVVSHLICSLSSEDLQVGAKSTSEISLAAQLFMDEILNYLNSKVDSQDTQTLGISNAEVPNALRNFGTGKRADASQSCPNASIPSFSAEQQFKAVRAVSEILITSASSPQYIKVLKSLQLSNKPDFTKVTSQTVQSGEKTASGLLNIFMSYVDTIKSPFVLGPSKEDITKNTLISLEGQPLQDSNPDVTRHSLRSAVVGFYHNVRSKVDKFLTPKRTLIKSSKMESQSVLDLAVSMDEDKTGESALNVETHFETYPEDSTETKETVNLPSILDQLALNWTTESGEEMQGFKIERHSVVGIKESSPSSESSLNTLCEDSVPITYISISSSGTAKALSDIQEVSPKSQDQSLILVDAKTMKIIDSLNDKDKNIDNRHITSVTSASPNAPRTLSPVSILETEEMVAAKAALAKLAKSMLLRGKDPLSAEKDLEAIFSHGALRPYTDRLVAQLYSLFLANSCQSPEVQVRSKSDSVLLDGHVIEDHLNDISSDGSGLEVVQAFTEAKMRKLLEEIVTLLLPPLEVESILKSSSSTTAAKQGCCNCVSRIYKRITEKLTGVMSRQVVKKLSTLSVCSTHNNINSIVAKLVIMHLNKINKSCLPEIHIQNISKDFIEKVLCKVCARSGLKATQAYSQNINDCEIFQTVHKQLISQFGSKKVLQAAMINNDKAFGNSFVSFLSEALLKHMSGSKTTFDSGQSPQPQKSIDVTNQQTVENEILVDVTKITMPPESTLTSCPSLSNQCEIPAVIDYNRKPSSGSVRIYKANFGCDKNSQ